MKKAQLIGLLALSAATAATAGELAADRFGALYAPGETAAFKSRVPGAWRVCDAWGVERAKGVAAASGEIRVPHAALGGRTGAFALTLGTNETWFAFLPTKEVKPCPWVGTGTHGGHGWQRGDLRYLDLIAAAGIGVVRDDINWHMYEKQKGVYSFSRDLHALVDGLKKRGIRFDPILNDCNPIYADALDPEQFTRFALAFVKEFKGKFDLCEIFNEPHNFNFPRVYLPKGGKFSEWQCRADAPWIPKHAALTRKVADAIRAADPTITTGVGVEDYWDFFKIMLKHEFVRPTDLVTIHPYDHEHYPPEGNWFFRDGGREVREYLLAHGGATRIAITECGWTTYQSKSDATHAFVGNYPPCTLLQQAQYLIRFYILARQHGIEFACQYDFMNDGRKRNYTEDNFGLVREDYTPKPSFTAVAAMTRLVGSATPCGSHAKDEKKYRLYLFREGDRRVAVAWSLKGEQRVALPAGFTPDRTLCRDIQGNLRPLPLKDGLLALTEEPIYLILPRALTSYVDPFVGTTATGHTTPAAAAPFGRIQAGPTTGTLTWEYCSGYRFGDTNVTGYAQTALSGTGFCEYNEMQVLPFSGPVRPLPMKSAIDKRSERAAPGFYAVRQSEDGVNVEIAAARRAALYRFRWDAGRTAKVLVNLPYGNGQPGGNQFARSHDGRITRLGEGCIEGEHFRTGCIQRRKVAFAFAFDRPWTSCEELPRTKKDELPRYVLTFASLGDRPLSMKVALSMTSPEAARRNLLDAIPDWNLERVRAETEGAWNALLARTTCEGSEAEKRNWYTSLYHLYFQPNDYSDAGDPAPFYTTLSLWDTFRAAQPWYTLAAPDVAEGAVRSFLRHYRTYGRLPVMSYGGVNFDCMIGNHSVPVIADLFLKRGAPDTPFWREAFAAIRNTLRESHPGKPKEDWPVYDRHGYFPLDRIHGESVSRTFECCYDDACAAEMAARLGLKDDAAFFRRRAQNWKNVFDPASGFARGKNAAGAWREPFDPFAFGHGAGRDNDFTEGNAFQYSWHVLHDPEGLFAAMGGRAVALDKLQRLFRVRDTVGGAPPDVTGLIGQYVHGNEPSHHVIYLFTLLGRRDLTAQYVREVFDRFYRPRPDGLCGNDDCGQMSAWYLFSALGFYPVNPCGGDYVLGEPQLPKMTLALPNGKTFTVSVRSAASAAKPPCCPPNAFALNGKPLTGGVLRHAEILAGGDLVYWKAEGTPPAALPPLAGDGVTDDTEAIQARLDAGASCVYLPPPKDHYLISHTLKIGSDQELRLDRFTRIRLAPMSDCPLLENRAYVAGANARVAVTGGIWDMDNLRQTPNPAQTPEGRAKRPKVHTPDFFIGIAMRFCHVEGLTVKDVTFRNPTIYGLALGHVSNFLVSDITFDYKTWNPIPLNMDGVHCDGWCDHGKITNLRGTCFDDLVALNANDGICAPEEGPIHDIDIDGIYADYCHSAVRLLSAGAPLARVTVRNVHGHFYCYTVGLTHYFPEKPRGRFDDIVIEDIFAAKALVPPECGGQKFRGAMEIVHTQGPIDIGNLVVSRVYREEDCLPTPTVGVTDAATVESLAVRDCRMTNLLKEPIKFLDIRGKVGEADIRNNVFIGDWTNREREAMAVRKGAYAGAAAEVRPKHVVVVGFDGLASRALRKGHTPTMDRLMAEGAWTLESRSILPSSSACNWHSFFTCSASEQHGFNDWNSRKPVFPPSQTLASGFYPDLFAVCRACRPKAETGFIYQWCGMPFCIDTNVCSFVAQPNPKVYSVVSFHEATEIVCAYLREKKPAFLSVCFGIPDGAGHEYGWDSTQYLHTVSNADAQLAKIVACLKKEKMMEETVVIVFSDHGGKGKGHGGPTPEEMMRPSIFWGKGVRRGYRIPYGGAIYDDGATVAALLGIVDPPVSWIGRPRHDAFTHP